MKRIFVICMALASMGALADEDGADLDVSQGSLSTANESFNNYDNTGENLVAGRDYTTTGEVSGTFVEGDVGTIVEQPADTTHTSTSTNESTSESTVKYSGTHGAAAMANAPMISAMNSDMCRTGTSAGISTVGTGISFGRTKVDENCERLKLAREIHNMGLQLTAVAILAQDDRVARALLATQPEIYNQMFPNGHEESKSKSKRKPGKRR